MEFEVSMAAATIASNSTTVELQGFTKRMMLQACAEMMEVDISVVKPHLDIIDKTISGELLGRREIFQPITSQAIPGLASPLMPQNVNVQQSKKRFSAAEDKALLDLFDAHNGKKDAWSLIAQAFRENGRSVEALKRRLAAVRSVKSQPSKPPPGGSAGSAKLGTKRKLLPASAPDSDEEASPPRIPQLFGMDSEEDNDKPASSTMKPGKSRASAAMLVRSRPKAVVEDSDDEATAAGADGDGEAAFYAAASNAIKLKTEGWGGDAGAFDASDVDAGADDDSSTSSDNGFVRRKLGKSKRTAPAQGKPSAKSKARTPKPAAARLKKRHTPEDDVEEYPPRREAGGSTRKPKVAPASSRFIATQAAPAFDECQKSWVSREFKKVDSSHIMRYDPEDEDAVVGGLCDGAHFSLYWARLCKDYSDHERGKVMTIQLLQADGTRPLWYVLIVYRKPGSRNPGRIEDRFESRAAAVSRFCSAYMDKTGNAWGLPSPAFTVVPGSDWVMDPHGHGDVVCAECTLPAPTTVGEEDDFELVMKGGTSTGHPSAASVADWPTTQLTQPDDGVGGGDAGVGHSSQQIAYDSEDDGITNRRRELTAGGRKKIPAKRQAAQEVKAKVKRAAMSDVDEGSEEENERRRLRKEAKREAKHAEKEAKREAKRARRMSSGGAVSSPRVDADEESPALVSHRKTAIIDDDEEEGPALVVVSGALSTGVGVKASVGPSSSSGGRHMTKGERASPPPVESLCTLPMPPWEALPGACAQPKESARVPASHQLLHHLADPTELTRAVRALGLDPSTQGLNIGRIPITLFEHATGILCRAGEVHAQRMHALCRLEGGDGADVRATPSSEHDCASISLCAELRELLHALPTPLTASARVRAEALDEDEGEGAQGPQLWRPMAPRLPSTLDCAADFEAAAAVLDLLFMYNATAFDLRTARSTVLAKALAQDKGRLDDEQSSTVPHPWDVLMAQSGCILTSMTADEAHSLVLKDLEELLRGSTTCATDSTSPLTLTAAFAVAGNVESELEFATVANAARRSALLWMPIPHAALLGALRQGPGLPGHIQERIPARAYPFGRGTYSTPVAAAAASSLVSHDEASGSSGMPLYLALYEVATGRPYPVTGRITLDAPPGGQLTFGVVGTRGAEARARAWTHARGLLAGGVSTEEGRLGEDIASALADCPIPSVACEFDHVVVPDATSRAILRYIVQVTYHAVHRKTER